MDVRGYFKLTWLRIRIIQRDIPSEEKEEKEKKERKFDLEEMIKIFNQFLEAFDYLKPVLQAFLKSLTLERLSLDLNLGFNSPVSTAMIYGYFCAIKSVLNIVPPAYLSMTPEFQKSKLDGAFELQLKLKLLWIVVEGLKAYTKKPVRELFGSIRSMNR